MILAVAIGFHKARQLELALPYAMTPPPSSTRRRPT